ncbi:MAG: hypothetical protein EBQ85_09095 [Proteobacteria bacterium]|nr:hypothetical protein [Pseudomonadota bacterium]
MRRLIPFLVLGLFFSTGLPATPKRPQTVSAEENIKKLESRIEQLETKVDLLSERSNLLAERTLIAFLNASYLKTGFNILFPRGSTFSFPTDTGLGVFVGGGHYFGRNHVVDGSFDWDLYPSLTLRYRYEWRNDNATLNLGPIVGVKIKLANQKPLDNFLDNRESLQSFYGVVGLGAGFPLGLSVVHSELLALFNQQLVIVASLGIHFFI